MSDSSAPPHVEIPAGHFWHGHLRHLLLLAGLLPGVWWLSGPTSEQTQWLGISTRVWFLAAVAVPIVQQAGVAILWRGQLCYRWLTRAFGDAGFVVWGIFFFPLLIARPLLIVAVGAADEGTLPIPGWAGMGAGALLIIPTLWTMHSVKKYFGFARALGGDHFFERYRAMPMVREGAFAHSSNAMYTFAFLGLWGAALMFRSQAALAVALFQHAYIWVHWYCTEQPDGVVLYGRSPDE